MMKINADVIICFCQWGLQFIIQERPHNAIDIRASFALISMIMQT